MAEEEKISFITPFDSAYPERLKNIPNAPAGLYVMGKLPSESDITVAVIGARECSDYGRYVAERLGAFLGERGVTVVSGMARGIDGISQWAALESGGMSIGVLGCGVDICYPAKNRKLYDRLLKQGAVLSEYPTGTPPRPMNFPARNRIVSGLADAVVVIEARNKSGTLITVDMALEQGREVFVVPGRVTDGLSEGCNRLLKQGAGILLSPEELLEELWELKCRTQENVTGRIPESEAGQMPEGLTEYLKAVKGPCEEHRTESEYRQSKEDQIKRPSEQTKEQPSEVQKTRQGKQYSKQCKEQTGDLQGELLAVYQTLDFYPRSIEQIREFLPYNISQKQAAMLLMQLCVEKRAIQVSPGHFCITVQP